MLDSVFSQFSALGQSLNAQKSHSFHFHGAPPPGTRPTNFRINSTSLHPIVGGDFHKFLGKTVSLNICPDYKSFKDLSQLAADVLGSSLAPWMPCRALYIHLFNSP
ncbi:hypothetical protein AVEN_59365-1 [Araneus ventricosus]|uniref:Uncharacterized protein n=1 Tax=Araneus ventricosus TaxID=182803 RepID=A0A4Y2TVB6_ARAVE|nr:hypothetical protein AVEN_59365-1 [Araneus ventricosus]